MSSVIADHLATIGSWRTWWLMAGQDIKLRYRRSMIGPFWISAAMAVQVGGIGLMYAAIFDLPLDEYIAFLGAGFLVWGMLAGMLLEGCGVLTESEGHLRALPIPTPVLAARMVQRNLVIFAHNLLVIGALTFLLGIKPTPAILASFGGIAVVAAAGYFWAVTMAPLCLRFRDVTQVLANSVQLAFFVTPILWRPSQGRVPAEFVQANPLYHLIELVRAPILGEWPTLLNWSVSLGVVAFLAVTSMISLSLSRGRVYLWL